MANASHPPGQQHGGNHRDSYVWPHRTWSPSCFALSIAWNAGRVARRVKTRKIRSEALPRPVPTPLLPAPRLGLQLRKPLAQRPVLREPASLVADDGDNRLDPAVRRLEQGDGEGDGERTPLPV